MANNNHNIEIEHQIRESLKNVGFTDYYINLYVGLLAYGEKNARELSDLTGVPYSRIYKILNEMSDKGIITKIDGRPGTFLAKEPKTVFNLIKKQQDNLFEENISQSLPFLSSLYGDTRIKKVKFNFYEGKACLGHLKNVINNSVRKLLIVIKDFEDLFSLIKENFDFMYAKGVDVKVIVEEKCRGNPELQEFQNNIVNNTFHIRYIPYLQEGFVISDENEALQGLKGHFDVANPNHEVFSIFSSDNPSYISYLNEMFIQLWENGKE